jgi:uncharacterized protein YcbK (DUF882 family)
VLNEFCDGDDVPSAEVRRTGVRTILRVTRRVGLSAILVLAGSEGLQNAVANGDTRTISMHHTHRGDDITVTFKRNGRYDADGLKKLNHFLRDWRTDEQTEMDPQLFDAVWEVSREFGPDRSIHIISSYRSPNTNAMLRRRSGGVARNSLHMQGKAMDFFIPGVPLDQIRAAGLRLQRGGVGFYPTSGSPFVHMDVGNVRHWPRMTRDQLVKVFPNQRTVHIPTDGQPLAGYDLALADIRKHGGSPSAVSLAARDTGGSKGNIFAKLFGFGKQQDEEDEADKAPSSAPAAPAQVAARTPSVRTNSYTQNDTPKPETAAPAQTASTVPLPKGRPANVQNVQVAAVQPVTAEQPAPIKPSVFRALVAITPNDIISSRGYWRGLPDTPAETSAARRRPADLASSDPAAVTTASIGPFVAPEGYGAKPGEFTLAYAGAQPEPVPERARPVPAVPRQAAIAANTTVATKATATEPSRVQSLVEAATVQAPAASRLETPWMRATMLTPSVESYMNTTLLGAPDFIGLRSFMMKPAKTVLMGFSDDPHHGMSHTAFGGSAVNFLATATFGQRTASLR